MNKSQAEIIQRIYDINATDPKPALAKFGKMMEETGELVELILMLDGYKYNKKGLTIPEINEEIKYECADVLMMLIILNEMHGHTFDELIQAVDVKLNKWEDYIKNPKPENKLIDGAIKIQNMSKYGVFGEGKIPRFDIKPDNKIKINTYSNGKISFSYSTFDLPGNYLFFLNDIDIQCIISLIEDGIESGEFDIDNVHYLATKVKTLHVKWDFITR